MLFRNITTKISLKNTLLKKYKIKFRNKGLLYDGFDSRLVLKLLLSRKFIINFIIKLGLIGLYVKYNVNIKLTYFKEYCNKSRTCWNLNLIIQRNIL